MRCLVSGWVLTMRVCVDVWVLGSPNGAVFAYFLLQRKEELGIKTITHITAVRNESPDPNEWVGVTLIFHVGDANGREL